MVPLPDARQPAMTRTPRDPSDRLPPEPIFFASPAEFRDWLARHHDSERELWVGFHRKASGRPSLTWEESVDEALCFGWIDGIRKSIDEQSYRIRFTPRATGGVWSTRNLRQAEGLIREGRMAPAGLRAFEARRAEGSGVYSFEQRSAPELPPEADARFRSQTGAWEFFMSQPPGYRRTALWWVLSAKKEETRRRRLETLIADSAAGRRIGPLRRAGD